MDDDEQDDSLGAPSLDRSCVVEGHLEQPRGVSEEAWRVVQELRLLLQREPERSWSLGSLGRRSGYEPHHLAHLFRRIVGVSPLRYLRLLRLERAAHTLEHAPGTSVARVGVEAGFSSAEGFSRAFRRTFGVAPRDYSRQIELTLEGVRRPPEGLDPGPRAVTLGPLLADSLQVASFEPEVFRGAIARLAERRPFDAPWQLGGVAQPWGWGPRRALQELRVLQLVSPGATLPAAPIARWRLEPRTFDQFDYHGSLAGTGVACTWLMTVWMALRRRLPAYGPVLVITEHIEEPTPARIYIPRSGHNGPRI